MHIHWWIEKISTGKLVAFGRRKLSDGIHESGCPNLQYQRKDARRLCRYGEKPIKVKIVKC